MVIAVLLALQRSREAHTTIWYIADWVMSLWPVTICHHGQSTFPRAASEWECPRRGSLAKHHAAHILAAGTHARTGDCNCLMVVHQFPRSLVEYSTAERDKRNNAHISARHEPGADEESAGKNPHVRAAPPAPADGVAGQAPKYSPVRCVRGRENERRCTLAR